MNEDRERASGSLKMTASHCPSADTVMSVGVPGREIDLLNAAPWPSLKNMETASPGEFPIYHRFPGPLTSQHGALVG